jgi:glycosyltransferase involved in cell wall biosynthesis
MYALCDQIIIHSRSGRDEVIELFHVQPEKITVIPHGNYDCFTPGEGVTKIQAKEALGIPGRNKTVLFFGAIRPNKGLDNLLFAFSVVRREIPDSTLLIVGEPCENYQHYRSIIEKENLHGDVFEKLEYIPNHEIFRYFQAADLVVLPYNEVTESGVLQLAYAFSKPVVATQIGGFQESVEPGQNGYLVPSKDVNALASRILEILADEEKMNRMGRHSRVLCDTRHSWDPIARHTVDLYAKC